MKLKEEEQRAVRYLETRKGCDSVAVVSYMNSIFAEIVVLKVY